MHRGERREGAGRETGELQRRQVVGGETLREEDQRSSTCLGAELRPAVLEENGRRTQAEAKRGEKAALDHQAVGIDEAELVGDAGS